MWEETKQTRLTRETTRNETEPEQRPVLAIYIRTHWKDFYIKSSKTFNLNSWLYINLESAPFKLAATAEQT